MELSNEYKLDCCDIHKIYWLPCHDLMLFLWLNGQFPLININNIPKGLNQNHYSSKMLEIPKTIIRKFVKIGKNNRSFGSYIGKLEKWFSILNEVQGMEPLELVGSAIMESTVNYSLHFAFARRKVTKEIIPKSCFCINYNSSNNFKINSKSK